MVNFQWAGSFAARAALIASPWLQTRAETKDTYTQRTSDAALALQVWYSQETGLWQTGWWNSGNVLTTLADYAMLDPAGAARLNVSALAANTFVQAQKNTLVATKSISGVNGVVMSTYEDLSVIEARGEADSAAARLARREGFAGFLNHFYDDEGWWALAWIRAFDVFKQRQYLDMAETIFADMEKGGDDVCGGGIWWNKDRKYKNAIANELYFKVAASLANRDTKTRQPSAYRDIAVKQWAWLEGSGMQNPSGLFNDGLNINQDGTCTNNGQQTWTYNQGVVLGGLVELHAATGQQELLDKAFRIAEVAATRLANSDGILYESCEPGTCGTDGAQFKGIFMRNLRELWLASPSRPALRDFALRNADSIWTRARVDGNNRLGLVWRGPPNTPSAPTADTHSSAMDALVAAIAMV